MAFIKTSLVLFFFHAALSLFLQDSIFTTGSTITKEGVIEYFNKSLILINSTYAETTKLLSNTSKATKENVTNILANPTSQIDAFIVKNWMMSIEGLINQAKNQGTFRNECLVYKPIAENLTNVLKPQIIKCTNEESSKTQAYYDNKNVTIPLSLNDFPSGLYSEILKCADTDVTCLNSTLGKVENDRGVVINELKSNQTDINKNAQESAQALDDCQMLDVYKIKYDNVFSEMAECLDVR